jgi:DNA-binding MarR family transcriptional regulator
MKLNEKQLDILKAIEKLELIEQYGMTDVDIAQEINLDISLVGHYLDVLKDQKYIDFAKPHDDFSISPSRFRIKLIDKGKVAINYPDALINDDSLKMNNINFNAPINAPIGVLQNSDGNTVNITQNNSHNIQEIINSLEFLEKEIQVFPEEEKQEALVYLDSLKTEIKSSQNPAKIRTFFKGFLKIATIPVLISLIVNGADFANNVTDLATKFDVDISHISLPFK